MRVELVHNAIENSITVTGRSHLEVVGRKQANDQAPHVVISIYNESDSSARASIIFTPHEVINIFKQLIDQLLELDTVL